MRYLRNNPMFLFAFACFGAMAIIYVAKALLPEFTASAIREAQAASVTRYFFHEGLGHFFRPVLDIIHPGPAYLVLEFPHLQALWSLLYHVFGFSIVWPKLLSVLFFMGTLGYWSLLLLRLKFAPRVVFMSVVFLAIAPLNLTYQAAMMVDPCAMFAAMAAIYYAVRYLETKRVRDYVIMSLCIVLASFTKIFVALPIFAALSVYFILTNWKQRHVKASALLLALFFASAVGLVCWFLWSNHVHALSTSYMGAYSSSGVLQKNFLGAMAIRFDAQYWKNWAHFLFFFWPLDPTVGSSGRTFFLLLQLAIMATGLVSFLRNHTAPVKILFGAWVLGYVVSLLLFFNAFTTHAYYSLSLQPVFALLFGYGTCVMASFIAEKLSTFVTLKKWMYSGLLLLSVVSFTLLFFRWLWPQYEPLGAPFAWHGMAYIAAGALVFVAALAVIARREVLLRHKILAFITAIALAGGLSGFDHIGIERFWKIHGSLAWVITPSFLQQMNFIASEVPKEEPIVLVSHRGFNIPEALYIAGRKGQMVGFPSSDPLYGFPPKEGMEALGDEESCALGGITPFRLNPSCRDWLDKRGFRHYFVVLINTAYDMPEEMLKTKMAAMGLRLRTRYVVPGDEQAVVLHYWATGVR